MPMRRRSIGLWITSSLVGDLCAPRPGSAWFGARVGCRGSPNWQFKRKTGNLGGFYLVDCYRGCARLSGRRSGRRASPGIPLLSATRLRGGSPLSLSIRSGFRSQHGPAVRSLRALLLVAVVLSAPMCPSARVQRSRPARAQWTSGRSWGGAGPLCGLPPLPPFFTSKATVRSGWRCRLPQDGPEARTSRRCPAIDGVPLRLRKGCQSAPPKGHALVETVGCCLPPVQAAPFPFCWCLGLPVGLLGDPGGPSSDGGKWKGPRWLDAAPACRPSVQSRLCGTR